MEVFHYNTLTINGITKICDNNIYLDEKDIIMNYQWHDFQLRYILEILDLSIKDDKTGLFLTNEQMYNKIINHPKSKDNVFSKNKKQDKKMGIISEKNKNTISNNNIGSIPNKKIKFKK